MNKNFTKFPDKELVKMIRESGSQSEGAFREIYDRYGLRVNAYCNTILNNKEQAEDILQETFINFYQHVREDLKGGTVIGYLITIARNLCLNSKRDKKNALPIEDFDFPVFEPDNLEEQELSQMIMTTLELLDADSKETLIMRVFNDLSYNEIGEIKGITAARARYLVFNAKIKIKNILSPYLKDEYNSNK